MRILAVTGIRSDYDILYPVLRELEIDHEVMIAVSGAHLSDNFSNTSLKRLFLWVSRRKISLKLFA